MPLFLRITFIVFGLVMLTFGIVFALAQSDFVERYVAVLDNTAMGFILGACAVVCLLRAIYVIVRLDGWTSSHPTACVAACGCAFLYLFQPALPDWIDIDALHIIGGLVIAWSGFALALAGIHIREGHVIRQTDHGGSATNPNPKVTRLEPKSRTSTH